MSDFYIIYFMLYLIITRKQTTEFAKLLKMRLMLSNFTGQAQYIEECHNLKYLNQFSKCV